ncbi:unnamed protein product [Prunus armeniaca]|uniref:F-box associated beta-propeller type 3 domain-containing protein n=1 Tax=Prunus armeniaca TaxID=36596 RepID=A0A6J5WLY5_PRUAR|nr:unnamed protein product [Prunus armeniaca]CAB4301361.1 unnamed protein product [Prunus armeniaca]
MDALPTEIHQVPRLFLLSPSTYGEHRMYRLKYDGNGLLTKSKHAIVSQFKSIGSYYEHDFVFCNLFGFRRGDVDDGRSFVLVNPLKGEVLMLPTTSDLQVPPNSSYCNDTYSMGFDNMTNTYKIVRVSRHLKEDHQTMVAAEVLVLGTSSWQELPSAPPCYPSCAVATSTHGAVHWLVSRDHTSSSVHILSFDFKNEEFYWTPHPLALKKKPNLLDSVHLLNFRGSLALVDVSSSNIEIWVLVLKNYDDKKKHEWVLNYKIYMHKYPLRLGTFVSGVFDFGEWEHGIYFHEQNNRCRRIILFVDLTHRSMKSVLLKDRQTRMTIHSCTDNIISLKNYGDLVEEEEEWHSKVIL